jgi:hypothetical protein|tara:strand:- start:59 stop:580 length:522 start_codon:yes stop_codon:yes gene_type:complete
MTEFISVTERNFISNFLVTDPLSYDRITDELTIGNWSAAMAIRSLDLLNVAVINSADELEGVGAEFDIIVPHGAVSVERLNKNADAINAIQLCGRQLFINCAQGMERSVLNGVWWLHRHRDMTVDDAQKLIESKRAVATNRLHWIGRTVPSYTSDLDDAEWEKQTGFKFGEAK